MIEVSFPSSFSRNLRIIDGGGLIFTLKLNEKHDCWGGRRGGGRGECLGRKGEGMERGCLALTGEFIDYKQRYSELAHPTSCSLIFFPLPVFRCSAMRIDDHLAIGTFGIRNTASNAQSALIAVLCFLTSAMNGWISECHFAALFFCIRPSKFNDNYIQYWWACWRCA